MLFLDNAAPDSCCAERPLHIPTYPRLVSTAAMVREKTWEQIHTHTDRPTDRPTDYNNPSLRMRARGLIISDVCRCLETCDRGDTREGVGEIHMQ